MSPYNIITEYRREVIYHAAVFCMPKYRDFSSKISYPIDSIVTIDNMVCIDTIDAMQYYRQYCPLIPKPN